MTAAALLCALAAAGIVAIDVRRGHGHPLVPVICLGLLCTTCLLLVARILMETP